VERVTHLTPLDVWFWDVEDQANLQHIGSVAVFDGPVPTIAEGRRRFGEVLPLVPRYRQRVLPVPFGLGRPVWVDADPDLTYHVRLTALPPPGGGVELTTLVGRVMSQPLDRTRPLWEAWVVTGLPNDRWALISKVHHCMVDGVAGMDLMAAMFDLTPEPREIPPDGYVPATPPSRVGLVGGALVDTVRQPLAGTRRLVGGLRHPLRSAATSVRFARGAIDLVTAGVPSRPHGLSARIGTHRVYAVARADLGDAKRIKQRFGVTVNDVALAAVTRGYRDLLRSRGERIGPHDAIRTMVPVSVRPPDDHRPQDNLVSTMLIDLPIGTDDPVARLTAIHRDTARHKRTGEAQAGAAMVTALGYLPAPLVEASTRLVTTVVNHVIVQRNIVTVTTNVPGPSFPLYVLGRRMRELFPYVLVGEGLTVGVAIFSYDGALTFGVTGDVDTSPDVAELAAGIEAGMAELLAEIAGPGDYPSVTAEPRGGVPSPA
jgi:WS/DGAT/MGAT family acyltransferase